MSNEKKLNPIAKFFLVLLFIVAGLIVLLASYLAFSVFNRQTSLAMIPRDYAAYLHTDSLYDSVNPLLDLQAADIFLATDEMSDFRGIFMMLRESELRNNKYVKRLASRKVDVAFYSSKTVPDTFVASIDLGLLSSITRLAPMIVPHLKVQGLSRVQSNGYDYFEFKTGENSFYIKPIKNLLVASNNIDFFYTSLSRNNDTDYTEEEMELLSKKTKEPIKLIVDAKKLAVSLLQDNPLLETILPVLGKNSLSLLSIGINDSEISLNLDFPLNDASELSSSKKLKGLSKILSVPSTEPELISRMSSSIQYYTVLNAANLNSLINAAVPLMGENLKFDDKWKTADSLANSFFNMGLEKLLFSWTDKEFAVLGIEGLNDPVFAIKISNEKARKEVFDNLMSSILLTENKSLILNGVRIPRIELPGFLQGLLKIFKIELPKPYYLVYNNYIYFSQSAESISTIYSSFSNGTNISFNKNWKEVSDNTVKPAAISLFYDLERSRPFFINSNSALSQILELYTIGHTDISIADNMIVFKLKAASKRAGMLKNIPGFPIDAKVDNDYEVLNCEIDKPQTIFWLEGKNKIKAMNVKQTKSYEFELPANGIIQTCTDGNEEVLFALTDTNMLFRFNNKLEIEKGFPINIPYPLIDEHYFSLPVSYLPSQNGRMLKIKNTTISTMDFTGEDFEDINLTSYYNGKTGVMYAKSFLGKIYVIVDGKCINTNDPVFIDKLGFGRPAMSKVKDHVFYLGFISQTGDVSLWKVNGDFVNAQHQFKVDGLFHENFKVAGDYFFALSDEGEIFRVNYTDGTVLSVKLDNITAQEGSLRVKKVNGRNYICVAVDGNLIYAFNENLELIPGFPVPGFGIPGFADVNGDSNHDCFALTLDNKLNAWNLR